MAPRAIPFVAWLVLLALEAALGGAAGMPSPDPEPPAPGSSAGAGLWVSLSVGAEPGVLTVNGQHLAGTVYLEGRGAYRFPGDFRPTTRAVQAATQVHDEILGLAEAITADYRSADGVVAATITVLAAIESPALTYQVSVDPRSGARPERFSMLDSGQSGLSLRGSVALLSITNTGPLQDVLDPTAGRPASPLQQGAPLLLWSEEAQTGYVLAFLDESGGPGSFELGRADAKGVRIGMGARPTTDNPWASPRLYIERTMTADPRRAFARYRTALDVLAPAPPIPEGFRHQWDSWYVYFGEIDENLIRQQIAAIESMFADLGPWQVVVDAGWYRSGDDPDGSVGVTDPEKFPSGMRHFVEDAHSRGVGVVLYFPAPWIETRLTSSAFWMMQFGFVRDHPDWLVLLHEDERGASYVYDFSNPALRDYLAGVVQRYLVEFDADGIMLDMVGVVGPTGLPFGPQPLAIDTALATADKAQTMAIYRWLWDTASRLKPNVWIEAGFETPPLARGYAHSWRLADDYPAFSHPYPEAGLLEQVTYAILQRELLGRRAHLGYVRDGDEQRPVQLQWLGAAVALQAQVSLGIDLTGLSMASARRYREYLAALRPFSGTTALGPGMPPESFSTTVEGTTYLGLLNNTEEPRAIAIDLAEYVQAHSGSAIAFDPETRRATTTGPQFTAEVGPSSFRLVVLRTEPGVLWADRSWSSVEPSDATTIRIVVDPSPVEAGRLYIYAPGTTEIQSDRADASWSVDVATGVATVDLASGARYELTVLASR